MSKTLESFFFLALETILPFGNSTVSVYTEHVIVEELTKRYPFTEPLKITSAEMAF
jgi:hypothetical protein